MTANPTPQPNPALEKILVEQFAMVKDQVLNQAVDDILIARFAGYKDGQQVFLMLSPFNEGTFSKNMAAMVARKILVERHCDAYALTTEMWWAPYVGEDGRNPEVMPSERPDRREAVMVYAEDREHTLVGIWQIERRESGRVRKLKRQDLAGSHRFESLRFGGLLKERYDG